MHQDSAAEADLRHQHFLHSAVSLCLVWGLRNDIGWAVWHDDESGDPILPLWSDAESAVTCAQESFNEYHPESISLEALLRDLLPDLNVRGIWVGTNLTSRMTGIDMPAEQLQRILQGKRQTDTA